MSLSLDIESPSESQSEPPSSSPSELPLDSGKNKSKPHVDVQTSKKKSPTSKSPGDLQIVKKFKIPILMMFVVGIIFVGVAFIFKSPSNGKVPLSSPSISPSKVPSIYNLSVEAVSSNDDDKTNPPADYPVMAPETEFPIKSDPSNPNDSTKENFFSNDLLYRFVVTLGVLLMLPLVLAGAILGIRVKRGEIYDDDDDCHIIGDDGENHTPYGESYTPYGGDKRTKGESASNFGSSYESGMSAWDR